jgi:hypothetical protein
MRSYRSRPFDPFLRVLLFGSDYASISTEPHAFAPFLTILFLSSLLQDLVNLFPIS